MKGNRLPPNKKRGRRGQQKRAPDEEPISVLLTTSNTYATPPPQRPRRRASTEADQKMMAWNDHLKNTPQSMLLTIKEGVIHDDKSLFKAFEFPRTLTKNLPPAKDRQTLGSDVLKNHGRWSDLVRLVTTALYRIAEILIPKGPLALVMDAARRTISSGDDHEAALDSAARTIFLTQQ